MLLGPSKAPARPADVLIVLTDNGTADIAEVNDITDLSVNASSDEHDYTIPVGEVRQYVGGPSGRILVFPGSIDNVTDTRRFAELEKSIVLRQITQYSKPDETHKKTISIKDILLYALIGVLLLAVIFK